MKQNKNDNYTNKTKHIKQNYKKPPQKLNKIKQQKLNHYKSNKTKK